MKVKVGLIRPSMGRGIMKDDIRRQMPKVGQRLRLHISLDSATPGPLHTATVVEINPRGLWFRARFPNGLMECYKLPAVRRGIE